MKRQTCSQGLFISALVILAMPAIADDAQNQAPQVSYVDASHSTVLLQMNGKQYLGFFSNV